MLSALGRIVAALLLAGGIFLALRGEAGIRPQLLRFEPEVRPADLPRWISGRLEAGEWDSAAAGYARLARAFSEHRRPALAAEMLGLSADALDRMATPSADQRRLELERRLDAAWHHLDAREPALAQHQLARLGSTAAPVLQARTDLIAARAALQRGNPAAALHHGEAVLANADAFEADRTTARLLLGETLLLTGQPEAAIPLLTQAARQRDALGETVAAADVRRLQARALLLADRPLDAERALRRGMNARARLLEFGTDARDVDGELRDRAQLASILLRQDRLAEAERLAMTNVAALRHSDEHLLMADSLFRLGLIRVAQGDVLRASGHFERAVLTLARADAWQLRPIPLLNLALAEMQRERTDAAHAWLVRTMAESEQFDRSDVSAQALDALAYNDRLAVLLELRQAGDRDWLDITAHRTKLALLGLARIAEWTMAVPEAFYDRSVGLLDGCHWREGGIELSGCDAL